jgi:hypothetical protein
MRAPVTAGRRIVARHGLFVGSVQSEKRFLSVVNGMQCAPLCYLFPIFLQLLCPSRNLVGWYSLC